ncbi:MAG: DMT family transporter [Ignavibacteriales bacterium]|nr:DMT family transporter [Ignavibacteriales bacterium]
MSYIGEMCALLTACCWSGSALAFSAATLRVGPIRLNVTRLLMAALLLFVTVILAGVEIHLSSSQLRNLAISGIIGLVIGDTYLFKAYENIGARSGMLIMSFAPAISALLAYVLLGEVLGSMGAIGMGVTLLGIAVVVLERREAVRGTRRTHALGILYGFIAAAGQGAALVLAKMAFNEGPVNGFVASLIRISSAVIIIFPLARLAGEYSNSIEIYTKDRRALWLTILGSFLGPFLGITLSLVAVTYTTVGIAATLMATVPILMLPLVKYVLKEKVSWRALAGAVVAVGGVAILFLR